MHKCDCSKVHQSGNKCLLQMKPAFASSTELLTSRFCATQSIKQMHRQKLSISLISSPKTFITYRQVGTELIYYFYASSTRKRYLHRSKLINNSSHSKLFSDFSFLCSPDHTGTTHASEVKTKIDRSEHFQSWAGLDLKENEVYIMSLWKSAPPVWMYLSNPLSPSCQVNYLSSHSCCKLTIRSMKHSVSICQWSNVATFPASMLQPTSSKPPLHQVNKNVFCHHRVFRAHEYQKRKFKIWNDTPTSKKDFNTSSFLCLAIT